MEDNKQPAVILPMRWTEKPKDICVRCFERLDPKGTEPHQCYPSLPEF